jgi:DNA-binding MarR family transcriptional regulator
MVVQFNKIELSELDLGHLALFLGLRVNELVLARMTRSGFRNVRESHGYVIQHLIQSERSITELARRMDVSQQMASKAVAELVCMGILEESPGKDRRAKLIRLSERGWKGVRAARQTRTSIHARLRKSIGEDNYERAQKTMMACLEELGGTQRIRGRRVLQPR